MTQFAQWQDAALGPNLRKWLGLGDDTPDTRAELDAEAWVRFTDAVVDFARQNPCASLSQIGDILEETMQMGLPLLTLQLAEGHMQLGWTHDFVSTHAVAIAALMTGDTVRARELFQAAQRISPEEPAPYVNMAQCLTADGEHASALEWIRTGLKVDALYTPLWQRLDALLAVAHSGREERYQAALAMAEEFSSWMGAILADDLNPAKTATSRVDVLRRYFDEGERSEAFLIEYSGALGEAEMYSEIPQLLWVVRGHNLRPAWQLVLHAMQAYLSLEDITAARPLYDELRKRHDLPHEVKAMLASLGDAEK